MKIVLTGACGFIGQTLIKELEKHRHELVLVDNQKPEEATIFGSGDRAFSPLVTDWPFILADIMDMDKLKHVCDGMDAVIHLAGIPTGHPEDGVRTFNFNAGGTFNMLELCRLSGVQRFVCASSVNAFGTIYWRINRRPVAYTHLPLTEAFPPEPQDPYSLSKLVNEETCAAFSRAYGIRTAALRFGGVWKPAYYEKMLGNLPATEAWSDDLFTWVHIQDVVTGIRQSVEHPDLPDYGAYTLNAGDTRCPEPTLELVSRFRPDYLPILSPIAGRDSLLSIEKARQAFGYAPKYRLEN